MNSEISSLEFPDLLYPEYLTSSCQLHEILLDQWPITTMDLAPNKSFVMQNVSSSSKRASTLRASSPPFTYSIANDDLTHMNKYTLSTKSKNNSTRLIAQNDHLIYVTKKNQLNIQFLPNNTYEDLWSNTIEHLSHTEEQRHVIKCLNSIKLLDCTNDDDQLLNIAVSEPKGVSFYSYDPTTKFSEHTSRLDTPEDTSILNLSFNPYINSNAIVVDKNYQIYQLNDGLFTHLHRPKEEKVHTLDINRKLFVDWDASPFLYTVADNYHSSCLLYDIRLQNESYKELFTIGNNHPYLDKTEIIRGYQKSQLNPYQHVFLMDYSLTIIDSRMPNRSTIHSHHELLRPPTSFAQIKFNNQHIIFINDEFNTNVLEYHIDTYRRLIQTSPCWELCPMSNSRLYLNSNNTYQDKELLFSKSIYFDVPIRDMAVVCNSKSFLLFQLNSAGNIHVQLFDESIDGNEEKTWNPDPDNLIKQPPDCFRHANDYWSTKFLPLFQCQKCLTYNVEPINFTIVTPLSAMMHTSLCDFPTFKNDHKSSEKIIPAELVDCPTCSSMPTLKTKTQLDRAINWIQDWKSTLDSIAQDSTKDEMEAAPFNWRQIFNYDELKQANRSSTLWDEIHRSWWPAENSNQVDEIKSEVE